MEPHRPSYPLMYWLRVLWVLCSFPVQEKLSLQIYANVHSLLRLFWVLKAIRGIRPWVLVYQLPGLQCSTSITMLYTSVGEMPFILVLKGMPDVLRIFSTNYKHTKDFSIECIYYSGSLDGGILPCLLHFQFYQPTFPWISADVSSYCGVCLEQLMVPEKGVGCEDL